MPNCNTVIYCTKLTKVTKYDETFFAYFQTLLADLSMLLLPFRLLQLADSN